MLFLIIMSCGRWYAKPWTLEQILEMEYQDLEETAAPCNKNERHKGEEE